MMKLYLNKLLRLCLLTGFFICSISPLFSQIKLTFKGIYRTYVEYVLIEDSTLYIYHSAQYNQQSKIKTKQKVVAINMDLGEKIVTKMPTRALGAYLSPWAKHRENIMLAWENIARGMSYKHYAQLERFELETKNTIEHKSNTRSKRNPQNVIPISDWFSDFLVFDDYCLPYYPIEYDFLPETDSTYLFYIRNKKELSIWHYNYKKKYVFGQYPKRSDWQEVVSYSIDTIPFIKNNPCTTLSDSIKLLPFGKHHIYQSIQDTSFFKGRFKVIQQHDNTFYINTTFGGIYYIGKEIIVKVGQVKFKGYPKWQFKKRIFIENRDTNQLIFFAKVEQQNGAFPFPDILVLKSRGAVHRYFPEMK